MRITEERRAWLRSLKVGDEVYVYCRYKYCKPSTIREISPSKILLHPIEFGWFEPGTDKGWWWWPWFTRVRGYAKGCSKMATPPRLIPPKEGESILTHTDEWKRQWEEQRRAGVEREILRRDIIDDLRPMSTNQMQQVRDFIIAMREG
jgi:hypothetical protein